MIPSRITSCGSIFSRCSRATISPDWWKAAETYAPGLMAPLGLIHHWYGYTRQYSPALLEKTPFQFAEGAPSGVRSPM